MTLDLVETLIKAEASLSEAEGLLSTASTLETEAPDIAARIKPLVERYESAKKDYMERRLELFKRLVTIATLIPENQWKAGGCCRPYDSITIERDGRIKLWKIVPYQEVFISPEECANRYGILGFCRSILSWIKGKVESMSEVKDLAETLAQVMNLYKEIGTSIEGLQPAEE